MATSGVRVDQAHSFPSHRSDQESAARPDLLRHAGVGSSFGTLGELVQGQVEGHDFLVTLPADLWSTAVATPSAHEGVLVFPESKRKSGAAALAVLHHLELTHGVKVPHGIALQVEGEIPSGKGMASSSADIVATCQAVASLMSVALTPGEISSIAVGIEPSDGVMYRETVVYDFMRGRLLERLGPFLPALALVVDPGGTVETLSHRRIPYSSHESRTIASALRLVREGFRTRDLDAVGRAATMSAFVNQRRHYKPELTVLVRLCRQLGGAGVVAAHSGTILTLLFPEDSGDLLKEAEARIARELPAAGCRRIEVARPEPWEQAT